MDPLLYIEALCSEDSYAQEDSERYPFLRNVNEPTSFSCASLHFAEPVRGAKGPIFGVGNAFKLIHGLRGCVPLSGRSLVQKERPAEPEQVPQFNPLAAKAATISLSAFGGGFFGFDFFSNKSKKSSKQEPSSQSNEWLQAGQCLIAKSYRAVSSVLPLVAKASQRPPDVKGRCSLAIVAALAALGRTGHVKNLRPQPPHAKLLTVALLGMVANFPLGVWMEHTPKYSPQWFAAICATVPFVGMLPESEMMPKTAMAVNLAASILGHAIGGRAERMWLKALAAEESASALVCQTATSTNNTGHCSEEQACEPPPFKGNASMIPSVVPPPEVKRWFCGWFCGWSPNVVINLSPNSQTYIQA